LNLPDKLVVSGGGGMTGGNNLGTPEASGQADNSGTGENVAAYVLLYRSQV